jgi:hypothetical protein
MTTQSRRTVDYSTLEEVRLDAEALAAGPYATVGNWTFGQILEHLAQAMHASIDGFPFGAPWYMRLVAPLVKNSVLTRRMKPGFKLPKAAASYLPSADATVEESLTRLVNGIERLEVETPNAPHPVFGKLAREEWIALHLRHSELHMSFVVPTNVATE